MLLAVVVPSAPMEGLARAIQLSVAPVFLLAGISGLLNVLSQRLNRIVDRARRLQEADLNDPLHQSRDGRQELQVQKRRISLVMRAIVCATVTILLVAMVVAIVFLSAVTAIDLTLVVAPLFVLAMACLMASVLLFLRETQLAIAQLRRRF
ncbi:DUF2721 domain-containing protein [Cyanobium sp. HWJ4-Hawea]|uniref:DUF2721 domain-containing protein n=1 Tax=unclassified Cyanobium TaxID=2627006 RepID=UPI0020CCB8BA|nr:MULTISPECIES: DUF2721 domain-containing protein [unclassified Cyanobium]MCP9774722.1 DUF2721 domain-containing protein [Cyanobium sp. WAJ14-Wanaka]MCP9810024.1 DUF2721 domain-containing protein [Cyanobium sp. HWJ4-Hawea]